MKIFMRGGAFLLCLFFAPVLFAGEYDFDLSEIEKKPYTYDGSIELSSNIYSFDKESTLYNIKYPEKPRKYDYSADLRLNFGYETGGLKYTVKTSSLYSILPEKEDDFEFTFMENYAGYSAGNFRINAGKMTMKWGKGYSYNPAAFLDRPKNIDSPEDAMEGYQMVTAEYTRSFSGALKNISYIQSVYLVDDDMNRSLGSDDGTNYAGKLYGLLYDTDIDFMYSAGESRGDRYGADFSRNLDVNFEIHGEYARYENVLRANLSGTETVKSDNWLIGFRYLTANDVTYILEYFHKSGGYSEDEMETFYESVSNSPRPELLQKSPYLRNNPMQDYIYLRASVKEPFDILYLTPAVTVTANLNDESMSISPETVYIGITNLEVKLKGYLLSGGRNTEFGEKSMDKRVEIKIKYYF